MKKLLCVLGILLLTGCTFNQSTITDKNNVVTQDTLIHCGTGACSKTDGKKTLTIADDAILANLLRLLIEKGLIK